MVMHVRTEGDKSVFSSAKFETFANLDESKPHIIIIFHLKTNRQKLEKYHVNGSQTRNANKSVKVFTKLNGEYIVLLNEIVKEVF